MIEVETWLRDLSLEEAVILANDDEPCTIENITKYQNNIKELMKKQKILTAIEAKCEILGEHKDINQSTTTLSAQLLRIIETIHYQLIQSNEKVRILETHLIKLRKQAATTPDCEDATDSKSSMPEHIVPVQMKQHSYEVETQTSESIQGPIQNITMVESSVQTNSGSNPTENIFVTQTLSQGHETIKIESSLNPCTEDREDVFVDAKYKQPNEDMNKSSELLLRNVPQTSFETIFVEPDNTTTEVVIDANGRKQIIVRKVTRTAIQQQKVIEQKNHETKVSSVVEPTERSVSQACNTENQSMITTVSHDNGCKTIKKNQSKSLHAIGTSSESSDIQEVIENPVITEEVVTSNIPIPQQSSLSMELLFKQSCVQTVLHHLTQRIIRHKKKIIRRVAMINGKEHVTEEVIEEPEEVEITEEQVPNVNINVIQMMDSQDVRMPIIELPADDEENMQPEEKIVNEPVIITESKKTPDKENKDKNVHASCKDKQGKEEVFQVFSDFEQSAQEEMVDNAQVVTDLPITTIGDVNLVKLTANLNEFESTSQSEQEDEEKIELQEPNIVDVCEIWPKTQLTQITFPARKYINFQDTRDVNPMKNDSIPSENIWPLNATTGHEIALEIYTFEQQPHIGAIASELEPSDATEFLKNDETPLHTIEQISSGIIESKCSENSIEVKKNIESSSEKSQDTYLIKKNISGNKENIEKSSIVSAAEKQDLEHKTEKEIELPLMEESPQPESEFSTSDKTYSTEKSKRRKMHGKKRSTETKNDQLKSVERKLQPIEATMNVEEIVSEEKTSGSVSMIKKEAESLIQTVQNDPKIVIEKYDPDSQKSGHKDKHYETKTKDVRSMTQLFIDNELKVSDETTRILQLTMSPKEPSSPGSVTVKIKLDSSEQPKLSVNLAEERLQSADTIEPIDHSVAESIEIQVSEDNTISDEMEMPEIEATPVTSDINKKIIMNTEQVLDSSLDLSPVESYEFISDLGSPVKVLEEKVISTSSSPKPLGTEVVIASRIVEEYQTQDVEQQTDQTNQMLEVEKGNFIVFMETDSRSMQTSPEQGKTLIDEEQQTSSIGQKKLIDIEVQTSPIVIASYISEDLVAQPTEKISTEVCFIMYKSFNSVNTF